MSIYWGVDQADAPLLLTHAYDLGAKYFFFWDNYQQACVPFGECLALARNLQAQVASHPARDTRRLKRAAEVAILLPPGYDLGHVHMGRGNLWGLGELNLERTNRFGISYRTVMGAFFTGDRTLPASRRAVRSPVGLAWTKLDDYREVVRVREDGHVEVIADGNRSSGTRVSDSDPSTRAAPGLTVELADNGEQGPRTITARARVTEQAAPVYYTTGTGSSTRDLSQRPRAVGTVWARGGGLSSIAPDWSKSPNHLRTPERGGRTAIPCRTNWPVSSACRDD